MADKIEDGGPAFPTDASIQRDTGCDGMSLRDWFAGQAIASIPNRAWSHVGDDTDMIKAWSRCAYLTADAMLKARKGEL